MKFNNIIKRFRLESILGMGSVNLFLALIISLLVSKAILDYDIRIAFAFIITLSFIILILINYKLGVEVYIALTYLIPFSSRILLYYSQSVPKRDILMGIQDLLLVLLILVYVVKLLYYKEKILKYRLDWFVLAFIGWNLIEIFNPNTNIKLGVYDARQSILPMFMYFIARAYFSNLNSVKRFLKLILFFSICEILYGLGQILFGYAPFDLYAIHILGWEEMYIWKQFGFIGFNKVFSLSGGSYNLFYPLAFFAILFLGLDKNVIANFKINVWRKIFLLLVVILFSSLIERTPIVMVAIGYLVVRNDFKSVRSFLKVVVIFIGLYSLLVFSVPLLEKTGGLKYHRFAELVNPLSAETMEWREKHHWQDSIEFISEKPIFGYGLGLFSGTSEAIRRGKSFLRPHSWYFKTLLDCGIIGFIFFILLFLKLFQELFIYIRGNYYFVGFAKALMGIMVATLLAGYANFPLDYHLGIFFWFLFGFFILLKNKKINCEVLPTTN